MYTKWEIKDNHILINREGNPPLMHSMLISNTNDSLTYRYWDYQTWLLSKFLDKKVLLLGVGGATLLQVAEKIGLYPKNVIGVDLGASELRKKGLLNYSCLETINGDAFEYIENTDQTFDLIIVDVYNFDGFVDNIYSEEAIKIMQQKLSKTGVLALHCLDPTMKYIAFNMFPVNKLPSVSYTVASNVKKHFHNCNILPLWTSGFVIGVKGEADFHSNTQNNSNFEYKYIDTFYSSRLLDYELLQTQLTTFPIDFTYKNIEIYEEDNLLSLLQYFKNRELRKEFVDIFQISNISKLPQNEFKECKSKRISQDKLYYFVMLYKLISQKRDISKQEIYYSFNVNKKNYSPMLIDDSYVSSFYNAWFNKWDEAIGNLKFVNKYNLRSCYYE